MARGMSEQTYLVMLALAEQPRHGYAVAHEVKVLSDGRITLGAGTLYGVLDSEHPEAGYYSLEHEHAMYAIAERGARRLQALASTAA